MISNTVRLGLVLITFRMFQGIQALQKLTFADRYNRFGKGGTSAAKWEKATWPVLKEITENHPEAGIHFRDALVYNRKKDQSASLFASELARKDPWFKDVVPNVRLSHHSPTKTTNQPLQFRELPSSELSPEIDNASRFTSVCINTTIYLPWLVGQCRKNGVTFKRASIKHIASAATFHHSGQKAGLVVNCTGLSSKKLGGVLDDKLYPIRGQIVVVRNDPGPMLATSGTDDGEDEILYIMTRAAGGGTILGGSYQKNQWDPLPDPNLAVRIMKRAIAAHSGLVKEGEGIEGLDIVRHGVGLRPYREGGPRIERERVEGVDVVHNYGHGGFGYQASFGCAGSAVKLVNEVLGTGRAKL